MTQYTGPSPQHNRQRTDWIFFIFTIYGLEYLGGLIDNRIYIVHLLCRKIVIRYSDFQKSTLNMKYVSIMYIFYIQLYSINIFLY